jgi:hypothetical protein
MKILLFLIPILLVAAFLYFRMKGNGEASGNFSKELQYGPFTIQVKASSGKTFNMDKGSVSYTNVAYSIFHNGKAVAFPGALESNTGLPFLWGVYALPGATDPTLIAGSQSLYLVYLKNGSPVVEPLLQQHHDFASLQFLDSENGQPGAFSEVFMKNNTTGLDKLDSLEGGRYLMVSEHAVLDVQSRKIWPMNKDNNAIENYSYPSPHGALAFSPDQKTIVFKGEFQSWNTANENLPDSEHALIAYHFEKDKGYAVVFDDTDTRMNSSFQDFGQEWFNTYFEWVTTSDGDRLQLRPLEKLPHWTGRLSEDNYYTLYPVKPGMLPVFFDFVLGQMAWTKDNILEDKSGEYSGRTISMGSGAVKLDIVFREDERELNLSKHLYDDNNPASVEAVKKIAAAFDGELSAGKHQGHFGRVINETKQIHGMEDY